VTPSQYLVSCGTLLHVFLEGRSGRDGLTGILMLERSRVTSIVHSSGSLNRSTVGSGGRCGSRGRSVGSRRRSVGYRGRSSGGRSRGGSTSTLLHVFLEGRSGGDGLTGILMLERSRVTSIVHSSGSLNRSIVKSGRSAESGLGRECGSTGNNSSECESDLHGLRLEIMRAKKIVLVFYVLSIERATSLRERFLRACSKNYVFLPAKNETPSRL
jgi:hypothetical protein